MTSTEKPGASEPEPDSMKLIAMNYQAPGRKAKALFAMTYEDAVALCSDDRSKGQGWMTTWSHMDDWQVDGVIPEKKKLKDTGALDKLIDELGLTKHAI